MEQPNSGGDSEGEGEGGALQRVVQPIIKLHDGGLVSAAVAVVRRAKYRHDIATVRPVVTLWRRGRSIRGQERPAAWSTRCGAHTEVAAAAAEQYMACGADIATGTTLLLLLAGVPTSMTSWCARDTSVRPLLWLKASEMSWPKVYPAPRGEMPQPWRSSGSLHSRSHMGPSCGTSCVRSSVRMASRVSTLGDNPPCRQNICCRHHHWLWLWLWRTKRQGGNQQSRYVVGSAATRWRWRWDKSKKCERAGTDGVGERMCLYRERTHPILHKRRQREIIKQCGELAPYIC